MSLLVAVGGGGSGSSVLASPVAALVLVITKVLEWDGAAPTAKLGMLAGGEGCGWCVMLRWLPFKRDIDTRTFATGFFEYDYGMDPI